MSLYTVKVAVKYTVIQRVEAHSIDEAEEEAIERSLPEFPVMSWEGCPYVIETRVPQDAPEATR